MPQFNRLMSHLDSINNSTNKSFIFEKETYELYNTNSPYISRHGILISQGGHNILHTVILNNSKTNVIVTPYSNDDLLPVLRYGEFKYGVIHTNFKCTLFPSNNISKIFSAHNLSSFMPSYIKDESLVKVYFEDTFSGYNEDGEPTFDTLPFFNIMFSDDLTPMKIINYESTESLEESNE